MQNFIQIGLAVSVLRMRDFALLGTKLRKPRRDIGNFFCYYLGVRYNIGPRDNSKKFSRCPFGASVQSTVVQSDSAILGGFLKIDYRRDARTDFDAKYVKRRGSAQGSAF